MKALLLTAIFCILPALARGDGLTVAYFEHPPYCYAEKGQATGVLVELTRDILKEAGIPATFVTMPPNRILENIRSISARDGRISAPWAGSRHRNGNATPASACPFTGTKAW